MGITVKEFYRFVEPFRDLNVWEKDADNEWKTKDAVWKQDINEQHINARPQLSNDKTFAIRNKHLYFNENNPPENRGTSTRRISI